MFRHVEFYPGDPILGLMEKYNQVRLNLGILGSCGDLLFFLDMGV